MKRVLGKNLFTVIPATEPESPHAMNVWRFRIRSGMTVSTSYSFRRSPSYMFSGYSKGPAGMPVAHAFGKNNRNLGSRPFRRFALTPSPLSPGERGLGRGQTADSELTVLYPLNTHSPSERPRLLALILIAVAFLLLSFPKGYAQDTGSGLDFLNIGPSSRMLSISEASTAAGTGASAIYSNPSLLVLDERSSLDVSYTLWIANVNNQFAAVNFVNNDRAFAFGVYSSGSDGFEARDRPGSSAGQFSIRYLSLSGAVAQRLGPFSIGLTGQFLREEVFQFRASGYAFSAGLTAGFLDDQVRTALSLKNIGNMESLDEESTPLPSSFNAGVSANVIQFSTPGQNDLPVLVGLIANWNHPIGNHPGSDFIEKNEDKGYLSLAMDINIGDLLFIQSGYRWGPTERPFSVGLGLAIESVRVNYALVPFSTGFGTVHSFGVQYYF